MTWLFVALGLIFAGGVLALFTNRLPLLSNLCGVAGVVTGAVCGLVPAWQVIDREETIAVHWAWDVPYGNLKMEIDPLSAVFLFPVFAVSALAGIYGSRYFAYRQTTKSVGVPWFFFNLLTASMVLVLMARNGVLFLFAWEIMSISCFFLITYYDEEESARAAGRMFLITAHLSGAFLLAFFVLLGQGSENLDFKALDAATDPAMANLLFLLALVGFGTKAGQLPFHIWLPDAYVAAPSHAAALLSGAASKVGIYGLLRAISLLHNPQEWWAWLLIAMGVASGMWGILMALSQRDLKRLLSYSSIENLGIITLGIGTSLLGLHAGGVGGRSLVALGLAGSLLHVINHSLYKSLLFLGAGSVFHSTGTREIDQLGGLLKRMPWTGFAFLIGSIAISGLPPLNGFVSEFLIYLGAFQEEMTSRSGVAVPALAAIGALALIGGLAAACFAKAFGAVFLGHPRSERAAIAQGTSTLMYSPIVVLALCCLAVTFVAPQLVPRFAPAIEVVTGVDAAATEARLRSVQAPLDAVALAAVGVCGLALALTIARAALLSQREIGETVTWDCGYAQPQASMQYTASSFVQPFTEFFNPFLRMRRRVIEPQGFFPTDAALSTEAPDAFKESFYVPLFVLVGSWLTRLRRLQHGQVHLYVLYIAVTIVVLLVWNLSVSS